MKSLPIHGEESIGFQTYNLTVTEQMLNHHALSPAFVVPNFDTQQMLVATNQAVMLLPECCHPTVPALFQSIRLTGYPETCTFSAICALIRRVRPVGLCRPAQGVFCRTFSRGLRFPAPGCRFLSSLFR